MCVDAPPEARALSPDFLETVGATAERLRDIEAFRRRLVEANQHVNLVGESTLGDFWRRHFVDSAQLLWLRPAALRWADLGSGAGLPGLVLAILLKNRPGAQIHLIESMTKRCRFLSDVVEVLALPAVVHNARAESLKLEVEMVTARACAPLDKLLTFAEPYIERGAQALFLKGSEVEAEIVKARQGWRFKAETRVSLSDPRGRLLSIEELKRVGRA